MSWRGVVRWLGPSGGAASGLVVSLLGMVGGAVLVAAAIGLEVLMHRPDKAVARYCDRQVTALLTSQNPVDVQRAGILVRELNCDVVHRIAKSEAGS